MSLEYRENMDSIKLLQLQKLEQEMPLFVSQYLMSIGRSKSVNTQLEYARRIKLFLEWLVLESEHCNKENILEITVEDLNKVTFGDADLFLYYIESHQVVKNGVKKTVHSKPATINAYLSAVSSMYNKFIRMELVQKNPFQGMDRAKKIQEPKIYLDKIDEEKFFSSVNNGVGLSEHMNAYREKNYTVIRDLCICSILNKTGIRVSELVGLDIDDIDIVRCRFPVVRKGGKVEYIYFSDSVKKILLEYFEIRPLFSPADDDRALFLRSQGVKRERDYTGEITQLISSDKRISVRSVERIVKKYAKAAQVVNSSKFSPHKLRHTYAMNMLKKTGNLSLVQKELGHNSIQATTIYAQSDETDKEKARNILDKNP